MSFSFKKAEAESRGAFSLGEEAKLQLLEALRGAGARNIMVLSTCNRTEVYWSGLNQEDVAEVVRARMGVSEAAWLSTRQHAGGLEAVAHLFRVGCALESQIPGDTEIAGQLKMALRLTKSHVGEVAWLDRVVSLTGPFRSGRLNH